MAKSTPSIFRPYLKPTKGGKAGMRLYRDLTRVQAGDHRTDRDFLRYVAEEADEIVAWTLVVKEAALFADRGHWSTDENRDWANYAATLLTARAEHDLKAEETCWTPLVDILVSTKAWEYSVTEIRFHDLLQPLRQWIQEAKNPSPLNELLTFKADEIIQLIGECAPVLSWNQVDRLSDCVAGLRGLSQNKNAVSPYARRLIDKGWACWQRLPEEPHFCDSVYLRLAWLGVFQSLVTQGAQLPSQVRTALIEEAEKDISDAWDARRTKETRMATIAAVALDPGLTQDELVRLMALQPTDVAVKPLILSRHSTYDMHVELLEREKGRYIEQDTWLAFIQRNSDLPRDWLHRILNVVDYPSRSLLQSIIEHSSADEEIWVRVLDSQHGRKVKDFIANLPMCLASSAVRARIRDMADGGETLVRLLPHCTTGAEWRSCFLRLIELSPTLAARELKAGRIPADAALQSTDLLPLLASDVQEQRLAAVCALAAANAPNDPGITPDLAPLR